MSQPAPEPASEPASEARWLEPLSALLLGLGAVLTALAAYLSAVQAGDEDEARACSIEHSSRSFALTNTATQVRAADQAMFAAWAEAGFTDNEDLTEYLTTLMRPELNTALEAWADTDDDGPETPFGMDEYTIAEEDQAAHAHAEATAEDARAQSAADRGDGYDKSTIYLALGLFFAGIGTTFRRRSYAAGLLGVSAVSILIGTVQLLTA